MEIGAGDLEQMVTEHMKELTHLIRSQGDVDENPSKLPFFTDEIAKNEEVRRCLLSLWV